jgi:predicted alpha/beta superfamily hydrolase
VTPPSNPGTWLDYDSYRGRSPGVVGTIKVLPRLSSPQLGNRRDILVYLPPAYADEARRFPVLYMHDGQNLFDASTSFAGEWGVDEAMEAANGEGLAAIVVGVPNAGAARIAEYVPFLDARVGGGRGDAYLRFLVETVKPLVDSAFRTESGRDSTGIVGSSLGGLISLYAFFAMPAVFGMVGALSPALWPVDRAILRFVAASTAPAGRIYVDVGTREGATELEDVGRLLRLLEGKGYVEGKDLYSVTAEGDPHDEAAWRHRVPGLLRFLLAQPTGSRNEDE